MHYRDCPVLCDIKRKTTPLITTVPLDEYTDMVQKNFDFDFTGESIVYPFELPDVIKAMNFKTLCIVGASGAGKSTLLREFKGYNDASYYQYDDTAIVSNFETPEEASERLSAVGLNSMPVWCRPRRVLSVGEGFRADLALNLESYTIFDEFTSTIDRNVAKSTCNGIHRFIEERHMDHIVFCSCHSDYIPFLRPDIIIDLDTAKVYDARECDLGEILASQSMSARTKVCGACLGNIII